MASLGDVQIVDLYIKQGDSVNKLFTFTDSSGNAINVSTWVFTSQIRNLYDDPTPLATFTFSQTGYATNQILMIMSSATTATLPVASAVSPGVYPTTKLSYDVRVLAPVNEETVQMGAVYVTPSVTR